MALLDRCVILHFSIDHYRTGSIAHFFDDAHRPGDFRRLGTEYLLRYIDLNGVQTPCTYATEKIGVSELIFTSDGVRYISKRAVIRQDPVGSASIPLL